MATLGQLSLLESQLGDAVDGFVSSAQITDVFGNNASLFEQSPALRSPAKGRRGKHRRRKGRTRQAQRTRRGKPRSLETPTGRGNNLAAFLNQPLVLQTEAAYYDPDDSNESPFVTDGAVQGSGTRQYAWEQGIDGGDSMAQKAAATASSLDHLGLSSTGPAWNTARMDAQERLSSQARQLERTLQRNTYKLQHAGDAAKEYRDPNLPKLSTVSPALRKRLDRLPRANDQVLAHLRDIEAKLNAQPGKLIYRKLRHSNSERKRARHLVPLQARTLPSAQQGSDKAHYRRASKRLNHRHSKTVQGPPQKQQRRSTAVAAVDEQGSRRRAETPAPRTNSPHIPTAERATRSAPGPRGSGGRRRPLAESAQQSGGTPAVELAGSLPAAGSMASPLDDAQAPTVTSTAAAAARAISSAERQTTQQWRAKRTDASRGGGGGSSSKRANKPRHTRRVKRSSSAATVAPTKRRARRAAALGAAQSSSERRQRALEQRLVQTMAAALPSLSPALVQRAAQQRAGSDIRKHQLGGLLAKMSWALHRIGLGHQERAMRRWRAAVLAIAAGAQEAAARRIQSCWWIYTAHEEVKVRRRLRERQAERAEELRRRREEAAATIQRARRRRKAYALTRLLREERDRRLAAACSIQLTWRVYKSRCIVALLALAKEQRRKAATDIERIYRGWRARQRILTLIKLRDIRREQEARDAEVARVRHEFKRHGAALQLQAFYRAHLHKGRLRRRMRSQRWASSKLLQRRWRAHRVRRRYKEKRAAAKVIQGRMRVFKEMLKLRRMKKAELQRQYERRKAKSIMRKQKKEPAMLMFGFKVSKKQMGAAKSLFSFKWNRKGKEDAAAFKIQQCFRSYAARAHIRRIKTRKRMQGHQKKRDRKAWAATLLQTRFRGWRFRKDETRAKQLRSASKIQVHWRKWHRNRRRLAILGLQRVARGHIARRQYRVRQREWREYAPHATRVASLVRGYLCRRRVLELREEQRRRQDWALRGKSAVADSKRRMMDRIILASISAKSAQTSSDLQGIFRALAKVDKKKPQRGAAAKKAATSKRGKAAAAAAAAKTKPGLDGTGFKRFFKEAKGLVVQAGKKNARREGGKLMRMNELDLMFARHKTKGTRRLTYAQFLALLAEVAPLVHPIFEAHKGVSGIEGRMFHVLETHVFVHGVGYAKKPMAALGLAAVTAMGEAAGSIGRMWLQFKGRRLQGLAGAAKFAYVRRKHLAACASRVQRRFRLRRARRQLLRVLNKVYVRYADPESGEPFYVNKVTGAKSWYPPALLRRLGEDGLNSTFDLPGQDDEFVVFCSYCADDTSALAEAAKVGEVGFGEAGPGLDARKKATVCCEVCEVPSCLDCFKQSHRSGSRKRHKAVPIIMCSACKYQVATRKCVACASLDSVKAHLCDNCFCNQHKKRMHRWNPVVVTCSECADKACRWWCEDCKDPFCTACFGKVHAKGRRMLHHCRPKPLYLVSIQQRHAKAKLAEALEQERLKAVELSRAAEIKRETKAATLVQSMWRSRTARRAGLEHMRQLRLWIRAETKRKKEQTELEATAQHKMQQAGKSLMRGMGESLAETKHAERLPGSVQLKIGAAHCKATENLSLLLEKGDRVMFEHVRMYGVVKKVRVTKGGAASMIVLQIPWDGIGDFSAMEQTNVHSDEEGNIHKVTGVAAYRLPRLNVQQRAVASTVRSAKLGFRALAGNFTGVMKIARKNIAEGAGQMTSAINAQVEELKENNETFKLMADQTAAAAAKAAEMGEGAIKAAAQASADAASGSNAGTVGDAAGASEWEEKLDEASGSTYYVNSKSGETSWEQPAAMLAAAATSVAEADKPKKSATERLLGFAKLTGMFGSAFARKKPKEAATTDDAAAASSGDAMNAIVDEERSADSGAVAAKEREGSPGDSTTALAVVAGEPQWPAEDTAGVAAEEWPATDTAAAAEEWPAEDATGAAEEWPAEATEEWPTEDATGAAAEEWPVEDAAGAAAEEWPATEGEEWTEKVSGHAEEGASDWQEYADESGEPYYYNTVTGETAHEWPGTT